MSRAAQPEAPTPRARPWGDYLLRGFCCLLLAVAGFSLVSTSTFAMRMREDIPGFVPGLDGAQSIALILAFLLAFVPLLARRRFLAAYLACSFVIAGLGAYWWTTIPWDELITESDFPSTGKPIIWDYLLVSLPALVACFYVVASRASQLKTDYRNRGAEPEESARAAAASYLAGVVAFLATVAMAFAMWALLNSGLLSKAYGMLPRGVPAIVLAAALLAVGYALLTGGKGGRRFRLRRPWRAGEDHAARERSQAQKSPS